MSIATERGDTGQTSLVGGIRVSKSDHRVETYGTIDELISKLGFARAICRNSEIAARTKEIQRELFIVASAISTPVESKRPVPEVTDTLVARLTAEVHRIEALDGILSDWSLPGEDPTSAAYDEARTICRRAERSVVGLIERGTSIQPNVLRYLNRLSDVLWLFGRAIELELGIDSRMRDGENGGPKWSRAW
jgi:cob(I)alamin adenosyltransferase